MWSGRAMAMRRPPTSSRRASASSKFISLPQDVLQAIEQGETVAVPSRQRSEAARLAYAATALARNQHVWQTPDVLPLEAWKAREIERRAASGEKLPRLLTAAEEWFLWRECTAEHTNDL